MKSRFIYSIARPALVAVYAGGILLLAGCSTLFPKNIPISTLTPTALTQPAGTTYPAAPTPTVAIITATPAPATAQATAPLPTATAAATAATGGNTTGGANGTVNTMPTTIAPPAQPATIQFAANTTTAVVTATLQDGATTAYQISVTGGQHLYITIDGNAVMQVYGPGQSAVTGVISALNPVAVPASQTGLYTIALQGAGPVVMSVYIPPVGGNQAVPAPVPAQLTPIQFQAGATGASFDVTAVSGTPLGYTITAQPGQQMTVTTNGNATITLLGPDKATLIPSGNAPTHQWVFPLNQGGTYTMIVLGSGPVRVSVNIPSMTSGAAPTPVTSNATRVTIASGNASTTLNVTLTSGVPQAYVLAIQAGQTLYVSTTGAVDVTIYGPNQAVITSGHASFPNRWSAAAAATGDYTFVISGNGPSTLTFYIPPM